jgi:hypothetical protein
MEKIRQHLRGTGDAGYFLIDFMRTLENIIDTVDELLEDTVA